MSPSVIRQSGPEFINKAGERVKPKAIVSSCEECGYTHAPFGMWDGKTLLSYCGYENGEMKCVGKKYHEAAEGSDRPRPGAQEKV